MSYIRCFLSRNLPGRVLELTKCYSDLVSSILHLSCFIFNYSAIRDCQVVSSDIEVPLFVTIARCQRQEENCLLVSFVQEII